VDELVGPAGAGAGPASTIDVVSFAATPPA
jgi:hypothetical protein